MSPTDRTVLKLYLPAGLLILIALLLTDWYATFESSNSLLQAVYGWIKWIAIVRRPEQWHFF